MEVIPLGKKLDIARETLITLVVGDLRFNIACTPENLCELAIGFLVSEGLVKDDKVCVEVNGDIISVKSAKLVHDLNPATFKVRSSGSPGLFFDSTKKLAPVSTEETFTLEECQQSLKYLESEQYCRTKGYHIAALVGKSGMISRAYDVGRHNAIDKTIGMVIGKDINFGRVFLLVSGRISEGMVAKCVRCRIPLLVSKAAILDSAIGKCIETGLSAVSFTTGIAVVGEALTFSPKPKSGKSNSK